MAHDVCKPHACNFCGACAAVVEPGRIDLDPRPGARFATAPSAEELAAARAVCPGESFDFATSSRELSPEAPHFSPILGRYYRIGLGWAIATGDRRDGASAGVMTALQRYLLETGRIKKALVTRWSPERPWHAEPFWARSPEDLELSYGSKYQTLSVARLLRPDDADEPFSVSAIGCQTEGIRLLARQHESVARNLQLVLGSWCSMGNFEMAATKFVIRKLGFRLDEVAEFSYRHGEYPGGVYVRTHDGRSATLHKDDYKWLCVLYTRKRCMACIDFTNELADLSVGDSFPMNDHPHGTSLIVLRTEPARALWEECEAKGLVALREVPIEQVYRSQRMQFNASKYIIPERARRLGLRLEFDTRIDEKPTKSMGKARVVFLVFHLRYLFRAFFNLMPLAVFSGISRFSKRR